MERKVGIIEIGSNNTKTHIYEGESVIYQNTTTIEFKKNYALEGRLVEADLKKLSEVIEKAKEYTDEIHLYGCSIFRQLSEAELESVNSKLESEFGVKVEVVSQSEEAEYTAYGCYKTINYDGKLCVFIGGGGSTELIFTENGEITDKRYYGFGVVDITNKFPSLKDDVASCTFEEIRDYLESLITDLDIKADILILAGGDHPYWYKNAQYELEDNTLYKATKQEHMVSIEKSDEYDRDCLSASLEAIRERSDNPVWFDGSRAMKMITNLIAHKIGAKYIIPTDINMEDGLKASILEEK